MRSTSCLTGSCDPCEACPRFYKAPTCVDPPGGRISLINGKNQFPDVRVNGSADGPFQQGVADSGTSRRLRDPHVNDLQGILSGDPT